MKYLSFVVPSYNAAKYLRKNVESLLFGKDDVEIIIVNDGSKDNTLEIAKEYEAKYPTIVKVVDKPNGGHGSTINAAIKVATGIYFKCVDADDWVDEKAYQQVLETIKMHVKANTLPDCYVTNFVYENIEKGTQHVDCHAKRFPSHTICGFDEIKKFGEGEFLMMHNLIHKLSVLKESKVNLPEHTFYVDNLFIYVPLYYTHTWYYIDCDFYRYYVGRSDQSVNFNNMTKNYLMQIRVMKEMSLRYSYEELKKLPRKQYKLMIHALVIIEYLTLFYISANYSKEKRDAYIGYLKEFKSKSKKLYKKVRFRTPFIFPFLLIPPLRRFVVIQGYKVIMKKTDWN